MGPFHGNIEKLSRENGDFRHVVGTFAHSQLVLMSLAPGEEIGRETHERIDQFFRIEEGEGKAIVDGRHYPLHDGIALVVPAGAEHNIVNTGNVPLKLYTIYSPANHPEGTVHATKEEALRAEADHQ
jgi:mannose-6-phosphate isomerase-like protein (cupin superfamily)